MSKMHIVFGRQGEFQIPRQKELNEAMVIDTGEIS